MVGGRPKKANLGGAFLKDIFREIAKTKNRFLSIFFIVAIGVGFFAGVNAASPDMKLSANAYYTDRNLSDFRILSTMGLTDGDVEALSAVEGIVSVSPGHWVDTVLETGDDSQVVKVMGYDFDRLASADAGTMNRPVLLEGRFPQSPDECVVESMGEFFSMGFQLGQSIQLVSGSPDEDLTETISTDRFTVVGKVKTPLYVSVDRGTSTIGSGKVDAFIMVPNSTFILDYYTEIYLRADGLLDLSAYSEEYDQKRDEYASVLEDLGLVRSDIRLSEIKAEAQEEIDDAQKELDDGIETQQRELADARQELADALTELEDAETTLAEETADFYKSIAEAEVELADALIELENGEKEYQSGLREYEKGERDFEKEEPAAREQIAQAKEELAQQQETLDQAKQQLDQVRDLIPSDSEFSSALADPAGSAAELAQMAGGLSALSQADPAHGWAGMVADYLKNPSGFNPQSNAQYEAIVGQVNQSMDQQEQVLADGMTQLEMGRQELAVVEDQLNDASAQLGEAFAQLKEARKELDDGWAEYYDGLSELEDGRQEGLTELADARKELDDGWEEYYDGLEEYREGEAESNAEIADAREKLADARADLAALETPEWYVLDRTDFPGYASFGNDSERIAAIAQVFPVFFLLVAALVCLTTMTRMVEEQRTQIGTLKALGYSSGAIASKFVLYALIATLSGSAVGLAVGFYLFPTVIYNAYNTTMYTLDPAITPFWPGVAASSTLSAVAAVMVAVVFACKQGLGEAPASLMRPKAPKTGKRVLLERIGLLWNRFTFSQKVTLRNLFRYKKRMLMTVVGISGCSALMLTGFGIYDSIRDIVALQFGQLYHYDLTAVLQEDLSAEERDQVEGILFDDPAVSQSWYVYQESMTAKSAGGTSYDLYLFVPEEPEKMADYITLRTRVGHEPLSLGEGAVLSEKLASFLDVEPGGSITFSDADHREYTVTVSAITENYASHYLYMTPQVYRDCFGKEPEYQIIQSKLAQSGAEKELSHRLMALDGVLAVSDTADMQEQFDDMIQSLTYVIIVIIISAGALAFVVLYNLSNINMTERIREIATIKVLGFYDREVSAYIYRENILLTLMGIGAGLVLGVFLHQFVVVTAETDIVMFGRVIKWPSYFLAAAFTVGFSLLVNLVLHFKLKKVSMVESLKSIE